MTATGLTVSYCRAVALVFCDSGTGGYRIHTTVVAPSAPDFRNVSQVIPKKPEFICRCYSLFLYLHPIGEGSMLFLADIVFVSFRACLLSRG